MLDYQNTSLKTEVLECYEKDNKIFVILSKTVFYPKSGGQLCDMGTIDDANVLYVFKKNNIIIHEVDKMLSGTVHCILDLNRRYNNSKLHTSQHLLSAIFEKNGFNTESFVMKDNCFSIDVTSKITREEIDCCENEINDLIFEGRRVLTRPYNKDQDIDLHISDQDINMSTIRVVCIEDLEKNMCGGTHVLNINKIRFLKIIKFKYNNHKTRLEVIIGDNAIKYLSKCFNEYCSILRLINQNEVSAYNYIESKLKDNKKFQKTIKKQEKVINGNK
ncbi:MAG: hypothetical protein ACK5NF_04655 [Bacilli bacterium]